MRSHLGRDEPEPDYWQQIDGRNNHGVAEPKFTVMEGRVEIDIKYLTTVITIALAARSRSHSALNDANRAIELGKYSDVLAMAQAFVAQRTPDAVDVAAST